MEDQNPEEQKKLSTQSPETAAPVSAPVAPVSAEKAETTVDDSVKTKEETVEQGKEKDVSDVTESLKGRTSVESSFFKLQSSVSQALVASPKARTYTALIMTMLAVIFFVVFTIVPTISSIISIRSEIEKKENVLNALKQNISTIETLDAQIETQDSNFIHLRSSLPYELDISDLRMEVADYANENNVEFISLRYDPDLISPVDDLPPEFRAIDTTIIVEAEHKNFVNFLAEIESNGRLFSTSSVSYTNRTDRVEGNNEYVIRGNYYIVRSVGDLQELKNNLSEIPN